MASEHIHRIEAITTPTCEHHWVPVETDDGTWVIQCDRCKLYAAKSKRNSDNE